MKIIQQSSFLQSSFWATFKSQHGWKIQKITLQEENTSIEITILVRTFARYFSLAYIPLSPQFSSNFFCTLSDSPDYFERAEKLFAEVQARLPKNLFCIRFDPPIEYQFEKSQQQKIFNQALKNTKIQKSFVDIQPPDTVILDLAQNEEDLLLQMKPKWRYNIKLAEKKGVVVRKSNASEIDRFYALYQQTAKRDGIAIHGEQYYQDLLLLAEKNEFETAVAVYFAEHNGETLAAIIVLQNHNEAVYLYGASSNEKRNFMPAYLLQWTAIQEAKKSGCTYYDFYGIPPTDDEHHPMHGLYRFKTGFGGRIVHRLGSFDIPISKWYGIFVVLEKIRAVWYKHLKKLFKH